MIKWLELTRSDNSKITFNTDIDILRFFEENKVCVIILSSGARMEIQETYSFLKSVLNAYPPAAETKPEEKMMYCEECEMFFHTHYDDCVSCGSLLKKVEK